MFCTCTDDDTLVTEHAPAPKEDEERERASAEETPTLDGEEANAGTDGAATALNNTSETHITQAFPFLI